MADFPILRDLGYVVVSAAAALFLMRPLRIPPLVAYMAAGLVAGPLTGVLRVSPALELLSELGIALLLFLVGLELRFDKLRDIGRPAAVAGALQVGLTVLLAVPLAMALGFDSTEALFLALAVAFSSTVVVVKLLDRTGDLGALHGRLSIGVLLVQDVLVAVVLTLVSGFAAAGGVAGLAPVGWELAKALLAMVGLALAAAAAARYVLPRLFAWLAESPEALFVASLTWVFLFILGAEALHVSVELGAFVAGVAMAQIPFNEELRRRVHPLVDFFLAVFFVTFGAAMDPRSAAGQLPAVVALSLFALLLKPLIVAALLSRMGHGRRTAFLSGLTLGQTSEFGFILVALGVSSGLLGPELLSLVGAVGLLTMGLSAVLVPQGRRLHGLLERRGLLRFLGGESGAEVAHPRRVGHVVVVGMNTLGRLLVRRLVEAGEKVLAVDTDPEKLRGLSCEVLLGNVDNRAVLDEADVPTAKLVVSAVQIEDVNSLLTYRCERLGVPVSVHAFDPSLAHELLEIGADHLMISKHDGIAPMMERVRRMESRA